MESPTAPEEWYRDTPIYVGNEMPIGRVQAFASDLEGYEKIWIDRDHNGWITVGFVGVDNLRPHQDALEAKFPDVGVVAVEMPYTCEQLDKIRQEIDKVLPDGMQAWNMREVEGVVEVWVGLLTPERISRVDEVAGDRPVCLAGEDPAPAPPPGPQPKGGDGWTFLAVVDSQLGDRPLFIADDDMLTTNWRRLGVADDPPENLSRGRGSGHLPPPPVRVVTDPDTVLEITVHADLREPGATPEPGEVKETSTRPPRTATTNPSIIETGFPWPGFTIDVSCGVGYLGVINSVGWHRPKEGTSSPRRGRQR